MFHEKQDIKLIKLVRQNDFLYDHGHEKYMDYNAREVAWQKIGDELKKPAIDCKERWINLRDVYRRILRKKLRNRSRPVKVYKYDKQLRFMRKFYKDVSAAVPSDDEEDNEPSEVEDVCDEESDDSNKPIKRKTKGKCTQTKNDDIYEEDEKNTLSTCSETPRNLSELDISDPIDAFMLSIGSSLKTFSPYHLNIAKSKIFSVVQEHELQQIVEKESQEHTEVTPCESTFNVVYTMQ